MSLKMCVYSTYLCVRFYLCMRKVQSRLQRRGTITHRLDYPPSDQYMFSKLRPRYIIMCSGFPMARNMSTLTDGSVKQYVPYTYYVGDDYVAAQPRTRPAHLYIIPRDLHTKPSLHPAQVPSVSSALILSPFNVHEQRQVKHATGFPLLPKQRSECPTRRPNPPIFFFFFFVVAIPRYTFP